MDAVFWAIIFGIIFAIIFGLIFMSFDNPIRRFAKNIKSRIEWWNITRKKGLKAIFSRESQFSEERLNNLFTSAKFEDTIFFAARTNYTVIDEFGEKIIKAIENGVILKFLILDNRILGTENTPLRININSLGSSVRRFTLAQEIAIVNKKLELIVKRCKENKLSGQLLIFISNTPIYSSAVIFEPKDDKNKYTEVLYDISFGTKKHEKFMQYYRQRDINEDGGFIIQLKEFYKKMFEPPFSFFNAQRSFAPLDEKSINIFNQHIHSILDSNSECEEIRNNSTQRLIIHSSKLLHSIKNNLLPHGPISAQIELTNKCSTRCEHCQRWNPGSNLSMDKEMAFKIIDQLRNLGTRTITFSGGEPTQHPDFIKILEYAKKEVNGATLEVGILSNGVGLSIEIIQSILSNASWLRLSIDGANDNIYSQIRKGYKMIKRDSFYEIENVLKQFNGHQNPPCRLAICYTIQEKNANGVKDMIDWVNTLGLPENDRHLIFKFAHGDKKKVCSINTIERLFLNPNSELQSEKYKNSANLPYLRKMLESKFDPNDVSDGRPTFSLYSFNPTRCFTPYIFMLIDPSGAIYPCCFLYEDNGEYDVETNNRRSIHKIGEFDPDDTNSLSNIWKNQAYKNFRSSVSVINPYKENFKACGRCTRHFIHNIALTQIYEGYSSLHDSENGPNKVAEGLKDFNENDLSEIWI
jgi:MoaA/NifB/PqqE/SkfB family radical SAM enzyme